MINPTTGLLEGCPETMMWGGSRVFKTVHKKDPTCEIDGCIPVEILPQGTRKALVKALMVLRSAYIREPLPQFDEAIYVIQSLIPGATDANHN